MPECSNNRAKRYRPKMSGMIEDLSPNDHFPEQSNVIMKDTKSGIPQCGFPSIPNEDTKSRIPEHGFPSIPNARH